MAGDLLDAQGLQEEEPVQEFEYTVDVRALETFLNVMRRHGLQVVLSGHKGTFASNERLNMRRLKEMGLISSYEVMKVSRNKELVESD